MVEASLHAYQGRRWCFQLSAQDGVQMAIADVWSVRHFDFRSLLQRKDRPGLVTHGRMRKTALTTLAATQQRACRISEAMLGQRSRQKRKTGKPHIGTLSRTAANDRFPSSGAKCVLYSSQKDGCAFIDPGPTIKAQMCRCDRRKRPQSWLEFSVSNLLAGRAAKKHESIEAYGRAEGVHHQARRRMESLSRKFAGRLGSARRRSSSGKRRVRGSCRPRRFG